ncbi:MAG: hypothetical protein HUJ73_00230 [Eubacterium sp.]|mgnify:FL=1|nr:hypothetical protein [Eubacterium sp.]
MANLDPKEKERLCRMIALARFEEKNEDTAFRINNSYQQDYTTHALIRNFILTTIAFVLVLVVIVMINMDTFLSNLNNLDLRPFLLTVGISYLIMLGVYSVISYTMARLRYARAENGIKQYRFELDQLRKSYRVEDAILRQTIKEESEE